MKQLVMFVIGMFLVGVVLAGGGKVNNPVIIDDDTDCVLDIKGLDLEDCEVIPAANQAGVNVFNCDTTVICVED